MSNKKVKAGGKVKSLMSGASEKEIHDPEFIISFKL
jgi:hypothetical protein